VLLSDEYGHADGYPKFVGNTFLREGDFDNYCTILQQYPRRPATGVFLNNKYAQAVSQTQIKLEEGGRVLFQAPVAVQVSDDAGRPVGDAEVTVFDAKENIVFRDQTRAAKTTAMIVAGGERLGVARRVNSKYKGFVDSLDVAAGEVRAVLVQREVTQDGAGTPPAYKLQVRKRGYRIWVQPLGPLWPTVVKASLVNGP
jgi:hypothetical protein